MPNFAKLLMCEYKRDVVTEKQQLTEKTFSKVAQVIAGKTPSVNSYAMLTAENPFGEEHGPKENAELNQKFEQRLRERGLGFTKIKGKFGGNTENSYLVMNPKLDDIKDLGKEFGQQSVIFGQKYKNDSGEDVMRHSYIVGDKVTQTRKTFHQLAKDVADYYSSVKGKKFTIPFFNDDASGEEFQGGKVLKRNASSDVNEPEDDVNASREVDKQKHLAGKTKLVNPNDRVVWVNKENEKSYISQGYKQPKG